MLVISRKTHQEIRVGKDIVITIVEVRGKWARVGISAPVEIPIVRMELEADTTESSINTEDCEA